MNGGNKYVYTSHYILLCVPSTLPVRYAVSVIWKLDQNNTVRNVWYGRTIVRSKYKLSYEVAQQLRDGAPASEVRGQIPELSDSDLTQEEVEKRCVRTV